MTTQNKILAQNIYLILAGMFIAALVASNLIFQKFFFWNPFGWFRFEISVGIIPYPITFLITDIISEIYGKKKANQVVVAGIVASVFSMGIIYIADYVPATGWSPVTNDIFSDVFGRTILAVSASMIAYLFAQFIDIRIFHYWKIKTKGKHLWLRNNFSTFTSQFIDTFTVVTLLCYFDVISWNNYGILLLSGFLFKVIIAALDTPILYALVYAFRQKFGLKAGEEIDLS